MLLCLPLILQKHWRTVRAANIKVKLPYTEKILSALARIPLFFSGVQQKAIILANKLVIPAAAERRAGIQKRPCDYWIPAFAEMMEW